MRTLHAFEDLIKQNEVDDSLLIMDRAELKDLRRELLAQLEGFEERRDEIGKEVLLKREELLGVEF